MPKVKGSPLKLNKSPSQHQNPLGKLGMGFDSETRWRDKEMAWLAYLFAWTIRI